MTAPDLAYVALAVDKPAAGTVIVGKRFGRPRRAFACDGSNIQMLSAGRPALGLFRSSDPCHRPDAGNGVRHPAGATAGPDRKFRGGKS